MILPLLFAIFLPWLSGTVALCLLCSFLSERIRWATVLGYGYLLGMVIVTLLMRILPLSATLICTFLVILCICNITLLWRNSAFDKSIFKLNSQPGKPRFSWSNIATTLLFAVITFHLYLITINLSIKPLFAWDAWATWSVKARTWFELKQMVTFVNQATWLESKDNSLYVLDAWHYPDTVPLIQTWVALMINRWDDSLVNLPWLFCLVAMGSGFYGQLKQLNIPPIFKTIGLYLIISLPLINTHAALAGYADIWLSAAYTFTMMALVQFLVTHSKTQFGLTLLSSACVALIKTEGIVLLSAIVPLLLVTKAPSSTLKRIVIIFFVSLVITIITVVVFSPIEINIPYLGRFLIAYHSVWDAVIINYFQLPSWHLLIYLVTAGLLYASCLKSLSLQQRKLILIPSAVLLSYLFVLFFLTQNYTWAQKYSSINRITLHLLPSILFCLFLIFDKRFKNSHMLSKAT